MLTCSNCGHHFRQTFDRKAKPVPQTEKGEEAKTLRAAKVNKQGPFCELCRHLEMAFRYAQCRGLKSVERHLCQAKLLMERQKPDIPLSPACLPHCHNDPY